MLVTIKELIDDYNAMVNKQNSNTKHATVEDYPCYNCKSWQECDVAFDGYNVNCSYLDCLGAK